ncbi:hypothetical protein GGS23DRAFT_580100 [Durotheca rogersii]|uniref:uncharacterized protein n=1 Tax=Durotheca rogersii TaxID=419775 RepID=UPI00221F38E4|nr:uncharacterized protein GGS23DRAFT_580100 [Durotheca rogersii]KAI5860740.1 hypothetical protein GGS23DRAFT_580100 [Durotheca rogersii]
MGMSWTAFLLTYLFGGVTLIPLLVVLVLFHAHLTFPVRDSESSSGRKDDENDPGSIVQPGDDTTALRDAQKEESRQRLLAESDVAAGYFAVCREYVPMGINAKPIERSTPVGSTTVAAPSQSVYQAMYKSIFDRKQNPDPLGDNNKGGSQRPKKAGNVFYVVLRHGYLMLFDDDEQLEVRHVISLAHHDVSIYSGGDRTPEGELFIKRNALCLSRKIDGKELTPDTQLSKPFYLFSENCSAKEDFYFALLRNQGQAFSGPNLAPNPQRFDVKNIISLVQKLHSSEEHLHTRWLNAFLGRIFLGIYKTRDIENLIREKITKKISRVNRPSFLSRVTLQNVTTGDAAPYFMNPRLKDFSVEGECGMEVDVKYTGNFRLEVAATARIDLGPRFKVREVNLVLAVVLRKLEGHIAFKIKPPPSNRIWFSFQSMPKMEMTIEPIVSSRQITYTVILRQIENRIKEVVAETLVAPFWDDVPFFNTEHKQWRGGIFEGDDAVEHSPDHEAIAAQLGNIDELSQIEEANTDSPPELTSLEKSHTMPITEAPQTSGFWARRLSIKKNLQSEPNLGASASTTTLDSKSSRSSISDVQRPLRSGSLSASGPFSSADLAHADVLGPASPLDRDGAAGATAGVSSRSKNTSPAQTPVTPSSNPFLDAPSVNGFSNSSTEAIPEVHEEDDDASTTHGRRHTTSSVGSNESNGVPSSPALSRTGSVKSGTASIGRGFFSRKEPLTPAPTNGPPENKRNTLAAMSNAAATAKRWGLNAIQRQSDRNGNGRKVPEPLVDLNQPMGRGQPLPPPGTPLPGPAQKSSPILVPKRKPVAPPPPSLARRSTENLTNNINMTHIERRPVPAPPLPRRRRVSQIHSHENNEIENVLVVAAPADSEPNSPLPVDESTATTSSYIQPWVEDAELNASSEELISTEAGGSSQGKYPPELPPRGTEEGGGNSSRNHINSGAYQHEEQWRQLQQLNEEEGIRGEAGEYEDDDEDGYTSWVDNPGISPSEDDGSGSGNVVRVGR